MRLSLSASRMFDSSPFFSAISGRGSSQPFVPIWRGDSLQTVTHMAQLSAAGSGVRAHPAGKMVWFCLVHHFCSYKPCNTHTAKIRDPNTPHFKLFCINFCFFKKKCFCNYRMLLLVWPLLFIVMPMVFLFGFMRKGTLGNTFCCIIIH